MGCCKCCPPVIPIFEFEINDDIFIPSKKNVKIPIAPETDINLLKQKVICEYLFIISELEKGHQLEIEPVLEEISAIDLEQELDNREFIIQYYLNYTSEYGIDSSSYMENIFNMRRFPHSIIGTNQDIIDLDRLDNELGNKSPTLIRTVLNNKRKLEELEINGNNIGSIPQNNIISLFSEEQTND